MQYEAATLGGLGLLWLDDDAPAVVRVLRPHPVQEDDDRPSSLIRHGGKSYIVDDEDVMRLPHRGLAQLSPVMGHA